MTNAIMIKSIMIGNRDGKVQYERVKHSVPGVIKARTCNARCPVVKITLHAATILRRTTSWLACRGPEGIYCPDLFGERMPGASRPTSYVFSRVPPMACAEVAA